MSCQCNRQFNRDDTLCHNGRQIVPTICGQEDGNTVWVSSWEQFKAVGGQMTWNEDQTEIYLSIPRDHKFSIQFQRPNT